MRLNQERQEKLEPIRIEYAKRVIESFGFQVTVQGTTTLEFDYNGCKVVFFPYSGWHSGSTIKDGRGIQHLMEQIT